MPSNTQRIAIEATTWIGLTINLRQGSIHVKAVMISGVYDIPAKSDVLCFGSHRGEYASTRCLHPGKFIQTGRGIKQIINFKL